MTYFKIGDTDFSNLVSSLKCGFEVLLSEDSGRNASGDNVVDIVNRKDKIYVTTRPMNEDEMASFLTAVQPFVVYISYMNPRTKTIKSNVRCYIGTPEPEFYTIQNGKILYKPLQLNFIEM